MIHFILECLLNFILNKVIFVLKVPPKIILVSCLCMTIFDL